MEFSYTEKKYASNTRPVIVLEYFTPIGERLPQKREKGKGKFLQFGVNYDEFDNGAAMFTTAIIEMPDGSILNHPVELVRFDDVKGDSHGPTTDT